MSTEEKTLKELFDLNGKVALLIGGGGYLGSAMSMALAEAGAKVAIGDSDKSHNDEVLPKLPIADDSKLGIVCDIGNEESARSVVDQAAAHFGRLDILVNTAVSGKRPRIDEAVMSDFDQMTRVCLTGPFIASQQAAKHMRKVGGGSVIHISSMYGMVASYPEMYEGLPNVVSPTYQASKGGIIQLTRYQAIYWAKDNIRVNCISPGAFPRPVQEPDREIFLERLMKKIPFGRGGKNWELKGVVALLASDASSFMTGQNLVVDGGWTAW